MTLIRGQAESIQGVIPHHIRSKQRNSQVVQPAASHKVGAQPSSLVLWGMQCVKDGLAEKK